MQVDEAHDPRAPVPVEGKGGKSQGKGAQASEFVCWGGFYVSWLVWLRSLSDVEFQTVTVNAVQKVQRLVEVRVEV